MINRLLIVEDDKNLRETLADNLELEGFEVLTAGSVDEAKVVFNKNQIDLIVLDVMLPDGDGYGFCTWVRQQADVLVLMLTARNLEKDVVEGFIAGCDDYVSKPYRAAELILRIRALLRRKPSASLPDEANHHKIDINGFIINWELRQVSNNNQNLHLTKTAFNILEFLYQHQNKCCSRDDILDRVWGKDIYVDNRTVDNFVSNLKKQLMLSAGNQYQIKTIRGVGYSLVNEVS